MLNIRKQYWKYLKIIILLNFIQVKTNDQTRRSFLNKLVVSTAGVSALFQSQASAAVPRKEHTLKSGQEELKPEILKDKKILVVWGGSKGHEPEQCVNRFIPWMRQNGADVKVFNSLEPYADVVLMAKIDLILQCVTLGTISKEQENGLLNAVKKGAGLAGWHGGLCDSFRNNTAYQFATGGQWVAHPGNIISYKVNIKDFDDPVMRGLNDFDMHSEQYFLHVDPGVKVLATTTFSGEHNSWIDGIVMPVVWKKNYDMGRVFYSSLGHVEKDFDIPEVTEIMKRGILWAVR